MQIFLSAGFVQFFQYLHNRNCVLIYFRSVLLGHSHVGLLLTSEEHNRKTSCKVQLKGEEGKAD